MIQRKAMNTALAYTVVSLGAIIMILPFFWMVSTSLKVYEQQVTFPPTWIPNPVTFLNYVHVWKLVPLAHYYLNSIKITVFVLLGQILSCSLAAFALARLRFKGREFMFVLILVTMMLPYQVTIIPRFLLMKALGWLDTYYPFTVTAFFGGAFNTFLLRQYLMTPPSELDEAARVDGCTPFQTYWRITLPLVKPALLTVGIFTFMGSWNDFFGPLIYISSSDKYTLQLGLAFLRNYGDVEMGLLMAASVVAVLPILIIYFLGQSYFVEGIALTGLKE